LVGLPTHRHGRRRGVRNTVRTALASEAPPKYERPVPGRARVPERFRHRVRTHPRPVSAAAPTAWFRHGRHRRRGLLRRTRDRLGTVAHRWTRRQPAHHFPA